MVKVSVITVNLNNHLGLKNTIESVLVQTFRNYEFLIIDGGSSDNSLQVIRQYEDRISYWTSENDDGIYCAMNKGIAKSTGEYCIFLNSGDCFKDETTLETTSLYLSGKFELICGSSCHLKDGKLNMKLPLKDFRISSIYTQTLPHQACFIKRNLFYDIGLYNEKNKIVSDWEFFVNCAKHSVSYLPVDQIIAVMEAPNISSRYSKEYSSHIKEREERKQELFKNYIDDLEELFFLRKTRKNSGFAKIKSSMDLNSLKAILRAVLHRIG